MTTKKGDSTPASTPKLERGRIARLLAAGFTVKVRPSKKRVPPPSVTGKAGAASPKP